MRRPALLLPPCALAAGLVLVAGSPVIEAARPVHERVTIRRDTYGIPHILAQDEEAAGFGFGYAQAEDHGEELGRRYLVARGEAARVFGRGSLESDFAMRRMDNRAAARRALPSFGRGFRRWLRGFVVGVNRSVAQQGQALPAWMPLVDEADVLANARAGAITSALSPPRELLTKYPAASTTAGPRSPVDLETAEAMSPDSGVSGSNALALAGSRTASGRPLLLGNPHLAWASRYWEAHVTIPGRLDFFGSTLVGIPVMRAGFNDRLGYVQTNNYPDLEDLYRLTLDPGRADHYVFEGRSLPLRRSSVTVPFVGDDGQVTSQTREFLASHLGPVVHRTDRYAFAVRAVGLEWWRSYEGFYELAFSRSLSDFQRRLARNLHPTSNFTYADADGNILYQWNARLPKRPDAATDYSLDVPAESSRVRWHGWYRVSDLPRLLNPKGGYIQNANNPPWWTSLRQPLDRPRFPRSVEQGPLGMRPQVALDALETRDTFTPDDVLAVKFTTRMLVAERVLPDLLEAVDRALANPRGTASRDLRDARQVLAAWDRGVSAASRGAVLFQRFWDLYREHRPRPHAEEFDEARPLQTPRGLSDPEAAVEALARAAAETRAAHGSLDVAWGEVHRFHFEGLDLPADGAPGSYGVYRVVGFEALPDGRRVAGRLSDARPLVGNGDAWILLVHFTRPVQAWSVLAYGETTRRDSRHAGDQIALFAAHRLRPAWFTDAEIRAHLEREYRP